MDRNTQLDINFRRCRGWYSIGKEKRGVYVTPPYQFASSNTCKCSFCPQRCIYVAIFALTERTLSTKVAGSATSSLEDPRTGEFVGQAAMDFLPDAFMRALEADNTPIGHGTSGFPVVITPEADVRNVFALFRFCCFLETKPHPGFL